MVDSILVALVEVDQKDHVVTQAADSVEHRHFDDERKDVVDEGAGELVGEHSPRQMRNGFQLVVDEKLRRHGNETCLDGPKKSGQELVSRFDLGVRVSYRK